MRIFIIATILFLTTISQAGIVANIGTSCGGDEQFQVVFSNGGHDRVFSGDGVFYNIGYVSKKRDYQITYGQIFNYKKYEDCTLYFKRNVVEGMMFTVDDVVRFGAGITYHFNNTVKGTGRMKDVGMKISNDVGILLGTDIFWTKSFYTGAKISIMGNQKRPNVSIFIGMIF